MGISSLAVGPGGPHDPSMEQRVQRLEECYGRIEALLTGFDKRFDLIDQRFDLIDQRFDRIDKRMDGMDARFDRVESRLDSMDGRLRGVETGVAKLDGRMSHIPNIWQIITVITTSQATLVGLVLAALHYGGHGP